MNFMYGTNFALVYRNVSYIENSFAALDRLQGSKTCYYGELLPTLLAVRTKLQKAVDCRRTSIVAPIAAAVIAGFERRFQSILNFEDEDALVATASHPYFKCRWLPAGANIKVDDLLVKAAERLGSINRDLPETIDAVEDDVFFFDFPTSPPSQPAPAAQECQTKLEVLKYIDDRRVNVSMLHDYPSVKSVFVKYNTNLCSSAPVERLFSLANLILRPNRRALDDGLFEKMLLLKANTV